MFDIRWNNIQTDIILPTCTFDIKDNIGSAESKGVELELNDRVTEHFRVSLGGNYTSAKIVDPVTILGVQKGDRVPGVPEYTISTSAEYTHPVGADARGRLGLNGQWIGPSQGTIYPRRSGFRPAQLFRDGRQCGREVGPAGPVAVHHEPAEQDKAIQRPNIAGVEYGITVRPRTFGIGGTYSF